MTAATDNALDLIRQVLPEYLDVEPSAIVQETELASIGADSLTLAELLFALEDRVGTSIGEAAVLPQRVSDLIALIEPHLARLQLRSAA